MSDLFVLRSKKRKLLREKRRKQALLEDEYKNSNSDSSDTDIDDSIPSNNKNNRKLDATNDATSSQQTITRRNLQQRQTNDDNDKKETPSSILRKRKSTTTTTTTYNNNNNNNNRNSTPTISETFQKWIMSSTSTTSSSSPSLTVQQKIKAASIMNELEESPSPSSMTATNHTSRSKWLNDNGNDNKRRTTSPRNKGHKNSYDDDNDSNILESNSKQQQPIQPFLYHSLSPSVQSPTIRTSGSRTTTFNNKYTNHHDGKNNAVKWLDTPNDDNNNNDSNCNHNDDTIMLSSNKLRTRKRSLCLSSSPLSSSSIQQSPTIRTQRRSQTTPTTINQDDDNESSSKFKKWLDNNNSNNNDDDISTIKSNKQQTRKRSLFLSSSPSLLSAHNNKSTKGIVESQTTASSTTIIGDTDYGSNSCCRNASKWLDSKKYNDDTTNDTKSKMLIQPNKKQQQQQQMMKPPLFPSRTTATTTTTTNNNHDSTTNHRTTPIYNKQKGLLVGDNNSTTITKQEQVPSSLKTKTIYTTGVAFDSPSSSISYSQSSLSQTFKRQQQPTTTPSKILFYDSGDDTNNNKNKDNIIIDSTNNSPHKMIDLQKEETQSLFNMVKNYNNTTGNNNNDSDDDDDDDSSEDDLLAQFRSVKRSEQEQQQQQQQPQHLQQTQLPLKIYNTNSTNTRTYKNHKFNENILRSDGERIKQQEQLQEQQQILPPKDLVNNSQSNARTTNKVKNMSQPLPKQIKKSNTCNDDEKRGCRSGEEEDDEDNDRDDLLAAFKALKEKEQEWYGRAHTDNNSIEEGSYMGIPDKNKTAASLNKSPMDDSHVEDDCEMDDTMISTSTKGSNKFPRINHPPHNPIALMKEEQRRYIDTGGGATTPTSRQVEDNLWSDSDNDEESDNHQVKKNTKKKGKSRTPETNSGSSSKKKRKSLSSSTSQTSSIQDHDTIFEVNDDGPRRLLTLDRDALLQILKPYFEEPKFGPYELEPLLLKGDSGLQHQVPASINRYLLPYQRVGIEFLHNALSMNMGAILGDEMGLGKTVQVLSLLCALFKKTGSRLDAVALSQRQKFIREKLQAFDTKREEALLQGQYVANLIPDFKEELNLSEWCPVLIVVPATTLDNWKDEFNAWAHFEVASYSGTQRIQALKDIRSGAAEVLLISNALFRQEAGFNDINTIDWKLVVIDEFHLFKNKDGTLSENLRQLKSDHNSLVLGMTGTLMQNDHTELWNLVDLINRGYLGSWEDFKKVFSIPIKMGRTKTATIDMIERSEERRQALKRRLHDVYIERKKEDVLSNKLPIKNEQVVMCEPSSLQKRIYKHLLTLPDFELVQKAHAPCNCGVNKRFFHEYNQLGSTKERLEYYRKRKDNIVERHDCCYTKPLNPRRLQAGEPEIDPDAVLWRMLDQHVGGESCDKCPFCCLFPVLQKLYKLSSHVALLQAEQTPTSHEKGSNEYTKFMKDKQFAQVAFPSEIVSQLPGGSIIRRDGIMDEHFNLSGKMKVLNKLLRTFSSEDARVLLFSYSTQTLDLIQNYLRSEGHSFLRMDGSTPTAKRQELANKFKRDKSIFIFLLSTKAMGLGLNLTEANKVIIFDVEWNPSWDAQAQDRAYRIGQKRNVQVLRLVTRGTIDEAKYLRQLYKVQLKQETLENDDTSAPKAARMFRAVQGDKRRKGELFGVENLMKFKDGSFLDDVWKRKGTTASFKRGDLEIHEMTKLSTTLQIMGEEKCDQLLNGNEELQLFDEAAKERPDNRGYGGKSLIPCCETNSSDSAHGDISEAINKQRGYEELDIGVNAVNHEDFLRSDRGRAVIQRGDEGFDEEMGGETQNLVAIYEQGGLSMLSENPQDGDSNDVGSEMDRDVSNSSGHHPYNELASSATSSHRAAPRDVTSSAVIASRIRANTTEHLRRRPQQKLQSVPEDSTVATAYSTKENDIGESRTCTSVTVVNPKTPRTIQLVGISSSKIAQTRPTTTFSAADLPFPSYNSKKNMKKKKKKQKKKDR